MLKKYAVKIDGYETTLMLSDADARRLGLLREEKQAQKPANKQAQKPANKSRTAKNKSS